MNQRLKDSRKRAGLKQEEAASRIGVGQSTISMWENGQSNPRFGMLPKIARVYGCEIADLFSESE